MVLTMWIFQDKAHKPQSSPDHILKPLPWGIRGCFSQGSLVRRVVRVCLDIVFSPLLTLYQNGKSY